MSLWTLQTFINNFFEPKHKQQWRGTAISNGGGVNLKESCLSVAVVTQTEERKLDTFLQILGQPVVDLEELRTASWRGIPEQVTLFLSDYPSKSWRFALFVGNYCSDTSLVSRSGGSLY
jgi:hypothetical protein